MEKLVLDTGIILGYARGASYAEYVEKKFGLFSPPHIPLISVVSKGEIYALAIQCGWGAKKLQTLDELLRKLPLAHSKLASQYQEYQLLRNGILHRGGELKLCVQTWQDLADFDGCGFG